MNRGNAGRRWGGVVLLILTSALVASAWPALAQQDELADRLQRAVQRLDQGDTMGAMLDLEGILARDEDYWPAYFYLGRAQAQLGDDLGAKDSFMRAATLNPGNAELHYLVATAAWALADFDAAWNQAIAARQAGYPQAPIDELLKGLDQYSDPPIDMQQRLAAPRVVVLPGDEGADADLLHRVRSAVFGSRQLGLVLDPEIADYRLEMVGESGNWNARIMGRDSDEVLSQRAAGDRAATGAIPGMEMESLVRDLEALAAGQG
jgi:tetratricopeptide (TPR) repeat protein